jgi:hypothetical protein
MADDVGADQNGDDDVVVILDEEEKEEEEDVGKGAGGKRSMDFAPSERRQQRFIKKASGLIV